MPNIICMDMKFFRFKIQTAVYRCHTMIPIMYSSILQRTQNTALLTTLKLGIQVTLMSIDHSRHSHHSHICFSALLTTGSLTIATNAITLVPFLRFSKILISLLIFFFFTGCKMRSKVFTYKHNTCNTLTGAATEVIL